MIVLLSEGFHIILKNDINIVYICTTFLQGMEVKGDGANLALNSKHVITAVDIAVGELKSRFSCLLSGSEDQASNAVSCFRVFNHDAWPENQIQLLDYGIEEVDVLLKHFGDILKK